MIAFIQLGAFVEPSLTYGSYSKTQDEETVLFSGSKILSKSKLLKERDLKIHAKKLMTLKDVNSFRKFFQFLGERIEVVYYTKFSRKWAPLTLSQPTNTDEPISLIVQIDELRNKFNLDLNKKSKLKTNESILNYYLNHLYEITIKENAEENNLSSFAILKLFNEISDFQKQKLLTKLRESEATVEDLENAFVWLNPIWNNYKKGPANRLITAEIVNCLVRVVLLKKQNETLLDSTKEHVV